MAEGTVSKNKTANTGKYSYKYVDIAQVHEYLESINTRYYQTVETDENGDYIVTHPIVDGKELPGRRGCRIVDATLVGTNNPAQVQGSAITYARRYSLLMAFGLATEDDDAQCLSKPKAEKKAPAKKNPEPQVDFSGWEPGPDIIEPEEAKYLEELIVTAPGQDTPEVRIQKVCAYYNVNSLYDLRPDQAAKLRKQLGGKA
jgi:hypothetical protein